MADKSNTKIKTIGSRAMDKLMQSKFTVFSMIVILTYCIIAVLGYLNLLPDFQARVMDAADPDKILSYTLPQLSFEGLLGTDIFGRSVFFKILNGAKTAITVGFLVTAISVPIGVILGSVAGYYGGKIDVIIVWLYSVISSVPYILLVVAISFLLGKGLVSICIALGVINWIGLCRLTRGEVMKHRNREYVLASKLLGASDFSIIFKHILPNVIHLAIISASLLVLGSIKSEVILTYLGVGIQDGSSWGSMITDATGELSNGIWWPLTGVTLAMFFLMYTLNYLGDALRDALDPKLK